MSNYIGNTEISKIYLGSTEIKKLYLGDLSIYDGEGGSGIDEHTYLMLHFDNNFADSSQYASGFTFDGGSTTYTSNGKFAQCVEYCGGGCRNSAFSNITDEFTEDLWAHIPTNDGFTTGKLILGFNSQYYFYFYLQREPGTTTINNYYQKGTADLLSASFDTSIVQTGWNHIVFCAKAGQFFKVFINGHLILTDTQNIPNFTSLNTYLSISNSKDWSNAAYSWMDELRLSNVIRWESDFTPPTQPYGN